MSKFISWYRAPGLDKPMEYLAFMPPYDEGQYSSKDGEWFYTLKVENAFQFDSFDEAKKKTPVYDGSANIEGRSGVYPIFKDLNEIVADRNSVPIWLYWLIGLSILYFIWQYFGR